MTKLITFSGSVGTGKTYSAKWTRDYLIDSGYAAYYVRYRFISLRGLFQKKKLEKTQNLNIKKEKKTGPRNRFAEFNEQRLSLLHFIVYIIRGIKLKLFLKMKYNNDLVILDRFLFDSLTQFKLSSIKEKKRADFLIKIFPHPVCAFIMEADFEILLNRRKKHSESYISNISRNYSKLAERLYELNRIDTSMPDKIKNKLKKTLNSKFPRIK